MTSKYQAGTIKNLASFCQNRSFWKTKFALISFYNQRYSNLSEMIIVLLEYLQLMSQALLTDSNIYDNPTSGNQFIFGAVVYFLKLVNPSYLLDFSGSNLATAIVLLVLLCVTFCKYLLCGYILYISVFDTKSSHLLVNTWKWIFRLQCRVICFFTTSFWIRTLISVSSEDFSITGVNNIALMVMGGLMIAAEYIFSFLIETRLCYVLPTRNFLSGKNYHTQLLTLGQKAVMQIAQIAVTADSLGGAWVVSVLNLVFTIIRTSQYFTVLPLYNVSAMLFQGHLLSTVTSLNVVYFFQTLLRGVDYTEANINFIVLAWIFISVLAGFTSHGYLVKRTSNMLTSSVQGSPEILVHRVSAMKQLMRNEKRPGQNSEIFDMSYLVSSSVGINLKRVFDLHVGSLHDLKLKIHDYKDANRIFLQYLETLGAKHSHNPLIKLHIAELCTRNPELYTKAIKIAADLGKSTWSTYSLTSSLLIYEIERAILASYKNDNTVLDLFTYIKSQMLVDDLRKEMLRQADLKIKVCENILNDVSNVGDIYDCAQLLNKSKTKMQKKMDLFAQIIPHYYIDPLNLCAEYSLILNYSVEEFEKYNNTHAQRYVRYEKQFKSLTFMEENLYQDTNAFLILSGQKVDNGKIMFTTRPLQNICGGEKASYFGTHVSTIFTPSLQNYFNELFRQILDTGKNTILNQITPVYLYHKDKYIVQAEFYVRIHPYITENLYLNMMIRPVPLEKEYLLIKEDGDIEGASQGLAKALNITSSVNVRLLSEELDRVSKAFNTVHRSKMAEGVVELLLSKRKSEKSSLTPNDELINPTNYNKAFDIFNTYTTKGQKVELRPIRQAATKQQRGSIVLNGHYSYHCNVSLIHFGPIYMKLVTLEEIGQRDSQEQISRSFVKFDHVINEHKKEGDSMDSANVDESVLASENVEEEQQQQDFASNPNRYIKKEFDMESTDRYGLRSPPSLLQSQYRSPLLVSNLQRAQIDQSIDPNMSDGYILPSPSLLASQSRSPLISGRLFNKVSVDQQDTADLPSVAQSQIKSPPTAGTKFTFKKGATEHAKGPVSLSLSFDSGKVGRDNALRERVKRKAGDPRYVSSHHSSQSSQERSFNRSYQRAITSKSYPKSFNILCAVFYIVIIFTLVSQFIMKSTADSTMDKLVVKKDMLKYAQIRTYKTLLLQINGRGAGLTIAGAMTSGDVGGSALSIPANIVLMKTHEAELVNANKQMMLRVDSLDADIRSALFAQDIRVRGSLIDTTDTKTKQVNQFQLIDEIVDNIETLNSLIGTSDVVSMRSYNLMNWLAINTLNDYLYKDDSMTDLFMDSVESEKSYFQNIIVLCLVITPILLGAMAVMLTLIIWYLYTIEKGYMQAFIRLSPSGVKNILASLRMFKKCLINEEEFQVRQSVDSFWNTALAPQDAQDRNYHKKHTTQVIKYGGIRFRYYKYVIKVVLYTAVLIGIMLWNFISAELSTNVIYRRQNMLEFANRISARVTTNYATFVELFASNNTNYVAHVDPLNALIKGISELQDLQEEIPSVFLEEDNTYDPDIQSILFVNEGCKRISATHMTYCLLVVNAGQPTNVLSAMSFYERSIKGKLQDYYNCNKTVTSKILSCAYINIAIILPTFDTITTEAFLMGNIIDANLMASISDASNQRVLILIIFSISLVLISALFWSQILIHLREVNNDFKKVLQVFPPNLILSSFLLKTFLKKTSHIVPDKQD